MELGVAEGNAGVDHKYAHFGTWHHSRTDAFDIDIPENILWYHTGAKILNLSKNSHFENLIFDKIHNFNISFLTKFTISKSHF